MIRTAIAEAGIFGLILTLVSSPSPQTIGAACVLAGLIITQLVKWLMHRRDSDGKRELSDRELINRQGAQIDQLKHALLKTLRVIDRIRNCPRGPTECPVLADHGSEIQHEIAEIEGMLDLSVMAATLPDIAAIGSRELYYAIQKDLNTRTPQEG